MSIILALKTAIALFSLTGTILHFLRPALGRNIIFGNTTVAVLAMATILWISLAMIIGGAGPLIGSLCYGIMLGYHIAYHLSHR